MLVSEVDRVSGQKAENLEAWGHLLKAIEITYSLDMDRADEGYAEKALALDPNLALAYWVRGEIGIYLYVEAGRPSLVRQTACVRRTDPTTL